MGHEMIQRIIQLFFLVCFFLALGSSSCNVSKDLLCKPTAFFHGARRWKLRENEPGGALPKYVCLLSEVATGQAD